MWPLFQTTLHTTKCSLASIRVTLLDLSFCGIGNWSKWYEK